MTVKAIAIASAEVRGRYFLKPYIFHFFTGAADIAKIAHA